MTALLPTQVRVPHFGIYFGALLIVFFITSFIMIRKSKSFFTMNPFRKKFSIMNLEFPQTSNSILQILQGIESLPGHEGQKVKKALKAQLYIDFIFMAAVYPAIFLLCMHVSFQAEHFWKYIFILLAWFQILPWLFDIIENIYLLRQLETPFGSSQAIHTLYWGMEILKWGLSTIGFISGVIGFFYF